MIRFVTARVIGCVVSMLACSIAQGGAAIEWRIEGGFAVTLPEGVTVSQESPVEDFILYTFQNSSGKAFLLAYLGNFPQALPHYYSATKSVISGFPCEIVRCQIRAKQSMVASVSNCRQKGGHL